MTDRTLEIEDIHTLEVINHPLRLRLLKNLAEPRTVRDLAEGMGVPVTRLYYHLDLLEEVGVVEVVETRKSGARLQRVYRSVATCFSPGRELLANVGDKRKLADVAAGAVLDGARLDAVAGVLEHVAFAEGTRAERVPGTLGRSMMRLDRETAAEFVARIEDLVKEMSSRDVADGEEYAVSFVFFPMVAPVKGETL